MRDLYDRIERAVADRNLPWIPQLRRAYLGFQRQGGYYTVGVGIRRETPVQFWIKLPLSPDELRALGYEIADPFPHLRSRWDSNNKQWEWEVPDSQVPDVGPAIDLTVGYQPPSGPMPLPPPA